jgi:hypothetical protein
MGKRTKGGRTMSSEDPKCDICGRENRLIKEDGKHFNFCPKVFHWHEGYKEHEKADFPIEKEEEVTSEEAEANARLISAAPEMLKNLEWAETMLTLYFPKLKGFLPNPDTYESYLSGVRDIRKTIAKATGKEESV